MGIGIGIGISSVRLAGGGGVLFHDNFSVDGALGASWTGATWAISGGALTNTPALGSELLTNGNMETGNPPTGWNTDSGSTLAGAADERTGGAGSQSLLVTRGSDPTSCYRVTGSGQTEWHRIEAWMKNVDATEVYMTAIPSAGSGTVASQRETSTSWIKAYMTTRLTSAAAFVLRLQLTGAGGVQGKFDDASIKKLTRSSLFATVDVGIANVNLSAPRLAASRYATQAGIVLAMDDAADPANFVMAYKIEYANPTIVIAECVAGVYNVLGTHLVSLDATKHFSAKKTGNQLSVFYGTDDFGTLVGGAPVTLDSALVGNTKHGLFSTGEGNEFLGDFMVWNYG